MKNNAINANQSTPLSPISGGSGISAYTINNLLASGSTTTGNYQQITNGASGTILQSSGLSSLPIYTAATYPSTATSNGILYASSTDVYSQLSMSANGVLITSGSSVPSISSTLPSAVQLNITQVGTVTSGSWGASTISVQFGGTGHSSFTSNSLLFSGTTSTGNFQSLSGGASGTILRSTGVASLPAYTSATYPNTTTQNNILYSSATNTIAEISTANNGLLITDALGVPSISTSIPPALMSTSIDTITSDYTVTSNDNGKLLYVNSSTRVNITVPNQSTEALTAGYNFEIVNYGTGDVVILRQNSDVLINANYIIGQGDFAKVCLLSAGTPNTYLVSSNALIMPVTYTFILATGINSTFVFCGYIPSTTTILNAYTKTNGGSITAQVQINGVNIGSAISVTTSAQYTSYTTSNIARIGSTLGVATSSNSATTHLVVSLMCLQRNYTT